MTTVLIAVLFAAAAAAVVCGGKTSACVSLKSGVSDNEQNEIVQLHNDQRGSLASGEWAPLPPATNMIKLRWESSLAEKAQEFANGCGREQNELNSISIVLVNKELLETNWTNVIVSLWYNDFQKYFTPQMIDSYVAHDDLFSYAPLARADLYQIGCGFNAYQSIGASIYHLYLCIYGPGKGEDMDGKSIYTRGEACSACPPASYCSVNESLCDFVSSYLDLPNLAENLLVNSTEILSNYFLDEPDVLLCTFDSKDCLTKSIGTNQWQLQNDLQQSTQKFYEVTVGRGGSSALFILNDISPTSNGLACLQFRYRKYTVNGSIRVPLKVFSWSLMGPPIEMSVNEDTQNWNQVAIPIQELKGYAIVFFQMTVPNDPSFAGLVYASIDDVRITATRCKKSISK